MSLPVPTPSPAAPRPPQPGGPAGPSRLHLPHGTTPALDSALWALAIAVAGALHVDGSAQPPSALATTIAVAVVAQVMLYLVLRGRARFATADEFPQILLGDVGITALLATGASVAGPRLGATVSVGTVLVAGALALTTHLLARLVFQKLLEIRNRPDAERARRTIVLGAGVGGEQAIRLMLEDAASSFNPVAILDDDPAKRHLRISGIRVMGPWDALAQVAKDLRADTALLAVPSADAAAADRASALARRAHLDIRVLPSTTELLGRVPARSATRGGSAGGALAHSTQVFRPLRMDDLLGRRAIDTDVEAIGSYLTGQRVLVTGAGGSIGSELCRQIAKFSPERLIMVDRDESALHAVELSLHGEARLEDPDLILGDLRTPGFVPALFDQVRPQIVFHAAALKHLPLTERFPEEAFLTNVAGTADLLQAAASHGVERFINISTDKAANPASVLGYSKRVAERLTASVGAGLPADRRFISVRFGNVLGSRGSALVTFASQLERGLPLTITDPHMERFFMSVDEACQLVLQAGALGHSGEVLVLDMGEPHNIEQVARRFAALMGYRDVQVRYTHATPGEKLSEDLFGAGEKTVATSHRLVSRATVPVLEAGVMSQVDGLREQVRWGQQGALVGRWMRQIATSASRAPLPAASDALQAASARTPRPADQAQDGDVPTSPRQAEVVA